MLREMLQAKKWFSTASALLYNLVVANHEASKNEDGRQIGRYRKILEDGHCSNQFKISAVCIGLSARCKL